MAWWKRQYQTPQTPLPNGPVDYPVGVTVLTTEGNRYLINTDGKKYRFLSDEAYLSWAYNLCVITTEAAVRQYPTAVTKLAFRDGTLLTNIADGKMYLASNGVLRHITSPAVLERLGVDRDRFRVVSDAEINYMKRGAELY